MLNVSRAPQANGLNSSGATMPPCGVVLAYSSSQNRRGGRSGSTPRSPTSGCRNR